MKTLIQNLGLTNTVFNEFLIRSNKNIGFLLKFYHGFSEHYHILELRSLFATFESLKSVEFPMQAEFEIRIENMFVEMPRCFKLYYSYITVYTVKNSECISLSEKYKVESGTKP